MRNAQAHKLQWSGPTVHFSTVIIRVIWERFLLRRRLTKLCLNGLKQIISPFAKASSPEPEPQLDDSHTESKLLNGQNSSEIPKESNIIMSAVLSDNRELKQATFLTKRTS